MPAERLILPILMLAVIPLCFTGDAGILDYC
jgi:hypothetical protein